MALAISCDILTLDVMSAVRSNLQNNNFRNSTLKLSVKIDLRKKLILYI